MTSRRPTFDDIREEQSRFIGPPAPPQIPKFTAKADREDVRKIMCDNLAERISNETLSQSKGE
jgi:hypothetical protein